MRALTEQYMAGVPESLRAFRELASLLLSLTVMSPQAGLRLSHRQGDRSRGVLGGMTGPTDPISLNDGRYLRVSVSMWLADTLEGRRLKVSNSGYQYQADQAGKEWICRYDYLREPGSDAHPQAHLQLRSQFESNSPVSDLHKIHFPTGRIAIEAVARLLADQFGVPCNEDPEIWRPALAESERAFQEIAHRPLSGPEA